MSLPANKNMRFTPDQSYKAVEVMLQHVDPEAGRPNFAEVSRILKEAKDVFPVQSPSSETLRLWWSRMDPAVLNEVLARQSAVIASRSQSVLNKALSKAEKALDNEGLDMIEDAESWKNFLNPVVAIAKLLKDIHIPVGVNSGDPDKQAAIDKMSAEMSEEEQALLLKELEAEYVIESPDEFTGDEYIKKPNGQVFKKTINDDGEEVLEQVKEADH